MAFVRTVIVGILCTLLSSAIHGSSTEKMLAARKQLLEIGFTFDERTFWARLANSDGLAVTLFVESGMNTEVRNRYTLPGPGLVGGADVVQGATPLMVTAWKGDRVSTEALLKAGATRSAVAKRWSRRGFAEATLETVSALSLAAEAGHRDVLALLTASGGLDGELLEEAFLAAVRTDRTDCIEFFLESGVDQDAMDRAYELVAERGSLRPGHFAETLAMLEVAGVSPETRRLCAAKADMRWIGMAMAIYSNDHETYPVASTLAELEQALVPEYVRSLPTLDPWGRPYAIESGPDEYTLRSQGPERRATASEWLGAMSDDGSDIVYRNGQFVSR